MDGVVKAYDEQATTSTGPWDHIGLESGQGGSRQPAANVQALEALAHALDGVSYSDLEEQHPIVAGALAQVVKSGMVPDEIRRWALGHDLPREWAGWLERAARYLAGTDADR